MARGVYCFSSMASGTPSGVDGVGPPPHNTKGQGAGLDRITCVNGLPYLSFRNRSAGFGSPKIASVCRYAS